MLSVRIISVTLLVLFLDTKLATAGEVNCAKYGEILKKSTECCQIPNSDEFENDKLLTKDVVMHCTKKFAYGEVKASTHEDVISMLECLTECTLNGTKFLTDDMTINHEVLSKMNNDIDIDPAWKNLWEKTVKACAEKSAKRTYTSKCKSGLLYFMPCVWEEVVTNCPASMVKDNGVCGEVKGFINKCSLLKQLYLE